MQWQISYMLATYRQWHFAGCLFLKGRNGILELLSLFRAFGIMFLKELVAIPLLISQTLLTLGSLLIVGTLKFAIDAAPRLGTSIRAAGSRDRDRKLLWEPMAKIRL